MRQTYILERLYIVNEVELSQNIQKLVDFIVEEMPVHQKVMSSALSRLTPEDFSLLDEYIHYCAQKGISIQDLGESYLTIVQDTFKEQMYFLKHGNYRNSSFSDVAKDVYFNEDYMSRYMFGLALTSFLWPNHVEIKKFFARTLPKTSKGAYLEIGPGHGYFLMKAMQQSAYDSFLGVDISETSIKMTEDIINHYCPERKGQYELRLADFLDSDLPKNSFSAVVMGEVLEHVEQPDVFMKRIHQLATDDAYVFVTTCCNAPAIDHIYLFRHPDEVSDMFAACGFKIAEPLILPYEGLSLEDTLKKKLSINVAYVLKKA